MNQSALHKGPTLGKFVLNGVARVWIAVGAAKVEVVVIDASTSSGRSAASMVITGRCAEQTSFVPPSRRPGRCSSNLAPDFDSGRRPDACPFVVEAIEEKLRRWPPGKKGLEPA